MILCSGEALIDMVPDNGAFRPLPGGAVFNTTVALGRLGAQTGYLWPISTDSFGELLLERLQEAGVDTGLCPRPARPTTLALVTLKDGDAVYSFYDEGTAGRMFAVSDLPALSGVEALFCGGISLPVDPCGATVEELIARQAPHSVVMVDPNIRPAFIADEAAFHERLKRILGHTDIVKLSNDDLEWLYPGVASEDAARAVLAMGPKIVLQTGGSAGARAHHAGGAVAVAAQKVTVADTIGAGDTFNAGVLCALSEGGWLSKPRLAGITEDALREALTLGAKAAAVVVSRHGANPPWRHEL